LADQLLHPRAAQARELGGQELVEPITSSLGWNDKASLPSDGFTTPSPSGRGWG
jgi:hypothetical protein